MCADRDVDSCVHWPEEGSRLNSESVLEGSMMPARVRRPSCSGARPRSFRLQYAFHWGAATNFSTPISLRLRRLRTASGIRAGSVRVDAGVPVNRGPAGAGGAGPGKSVQFWTPRPPQGTPSESIGRLLRQCMCQWRTSSKGVWTSTRGPAQVVGRPRESFKLDVLPQ